MLVVDPRAAATTMRALPLLLAAAMLLALPRAARWQQLPLDRAPLAQCNNLFLKIGNQS